MRTSVVITGIGMVTPLGTNPSEILSGIEAGHSAVAQPTTFDATPFACPVCAEIRDFQPQRYLSESKMIRLMNRDAQLAVAAAHLALMDAGVKSAVVYPPEEIGLYGATGLAGLPLAEVIPLIKASSDEDGNFDPGRFGRMGLRAVSPILSFKILSNMPLCFVSICENIQGPSGIYTPWEGQGAQAIETAIRALESGDVACALVGGCDVKTHELAFLSLEQHGLFASWQQNHFGIVPGEGAVFLVMENADRAIARGARMYARVSSFSLRTHQPGGNRAVQNRGPGAGGPCYQWTRKVRGKTLSVALSRDQFEWLRQAIRNWRQLQQTLKAMQRLSRAVLFATVPHPPRRKRLSKKVLGLI